MVNLHKAHAVTCIVSILHPYGGVLKTLQATRLLFLVRRLRQVQPTTEQKLRSQPILFVTLHLTLIKIRCCKYYY